MNPHLSVVIPVYDNWWLTARALRVLEGLRGSTLPFETIVVDNASSDETPSAIAGFPWVRYARTERNQNFAGACNAGARLAEAPLILFLNNDAYPLGDALGPLVRAFDRPEVAIAGGSLFFEDGVTQCAGFVMLPNAHWHYSYRNLPPMLDGVTTSRNALGVSGAAMAVRTEWFLGEGGFDETYINGFEDVDLCMRAREGGRAIRYVADARFAHYEGASAGRFDREAENEARFYQRWSARLGGMPRTARGHVRGISVHIASGAPALLAAGLEDLEAGLRAFGHPIVRGGVRFRHRFDARFRQSASLEWFTTGNARAAVAVEGTGSAGPTIQVRGGADVRVAWLPCAAPDRIAMLPVRPSDDPACTAVAIAGFESASPHAKGETIAMLDDLLARGLAGAFIELTQDAGAGELASRYGERADAVALLTLDGARRDVACVVHAGLTDAAAFGNVLLAQSALPAIAMDGGLGGLLAPDVASIARSGELVERVANLLNGVQARVRYGTLLAADARRRFSPRRSAIRVVDLLCAARFGLERPSVARSNSPLAR